MKLFALFGNPVAHSLSPLMQNYAMDCMGLQGGYIRYKINNANELKKQFFASKLSGANITVPLKEDAYQICNEINGIAKNIKAVNTIIKKENMLIGYNTDAYGFLASIAEFGKINNALILGAGGSAKAISYALKEAKIEVTIVNRSQEKLSFFEENNFECYVHDKLKPQNYDLIINATSAGLDNEFYPIKKEILKEIFLKSKFAIDIIYNKKTPFLQLAQDMNLQNKDGLDMLVYQGVKALALFFDKSLDENKTANFMKKALNMRGLKTSQ